MNFSIFSEFILLEMSANIFVNWISISCTDNFYLTNMLLDGTR